MEREESRRLGIRKGGGVNRMRIITVKIDEYLYQELQLCAINEKRSMSSIIRDALMRYLENSKEAEEE